MGLWSRSTPAASAGPTCTGSRPAAAPPATSWDTSSPGPSPSWAATSAAAALGADVVLDSRETSLAEYARTEGVAFAQAFECSAAPDAVAACASTLAVGGTLVEVALPDAPGAVPVRSFVTRSLRLVGSCAYGVEDYRRAVELLDSGGLDVGPLVSERV